jgi:hypothetical protein
VRPHSRAGDWLVASASNCRDSKTDPFLPPRNIAEGQARHTTGEFIQFISRAEGSTAELETQVILSIELGFAGEKSTKAVFILLDDIRRMLNGLRRKLSAINE